MIFFVVLIYNHWVYGAQENNIPQLFSTQLVPTYEKLQRGRFYPLGSSMALDYRYSMPSKAKAVLILVNGYTQFSGLWSELVWDLKDEPLGLFLFDHRGQGFSDREGGTPFTHITSFQDYVNDMKSFIEAVVAPMAPGVPLYLLAHSMGGCVATLYLQQNPHMVKKALLSAPMMLMDTGGFPLPLVHFFGVAFGNIAPKSPVITRSTPMDWRDEEGLKRNTQSPLRHWLKKNLQYRYPWATAGGATWKWARASVESHYELFQNVKKLTVPIHILQALQEKPVVDNTAQTRFCEQAPNCTLEKLDGRHELFNEVDPVRNRAIEALKKMLDL